MSLARNQFILTHRAILDALVEPVTLDKGLGSTPHNEMARLLRNGLAVMIFSSLEGFLRERVIELLRDIDQNAAPFASLSEGMQRTITVGAVEGLYNRIKNLKMADAIQVVQNEAPFLGSLDKQTAFGISSFCYGRDKSNLSPEDVKTALLAFGVVGDPWENMRNVSVKANFGGLVAPNSQYKAISQTRHGAAHNASFQVAASELSDHAKNAFAIAISFDILATTCKKAINSRAPKVVGTPTHTALNYLVIAPRNVSKTSWALAQLGGARAIKLANAPALLQVKGMTMMKDSTAMLELDGSGTPQSWFV